MPIQAGGGRAAECMAKLLNWEIVHAQAGSYALRLQFFHLSFSPMPCRTTNEVDLFCYFSPLFLSLAFFAVNKIRLEVNFR